MKQINAHEFYKLVTKESIENAIKFIDENDLATTFNPPTKYQLAINEKYYPPKEVLRVVAQQMGYKIIEHTFAGGYANKPFQKLGYKIMDKNIENKTIHHFISELIKTKIFSSLINEREFHFSKIYNIKNEFENFKISNNEIDFIIENYVQNYTTNYENFCNNISDLNIKYFAVIIGKLIAHIDLKASGKNKWNTYDDKRIIANSSVRQTNWVSFFCNIKKNANFKNEGSIQNAWDYVCYPEENFTILSNNHRKLISEKILHTEYNDKIFCKQLIEWFTTNHQDVKTNEPQNYTYLISSLLYHKNILPFWKLEDTNYWIFQGNPKIFDFETALKQDILTDWTVSTHKDEIQIGDKVILWITGNNSGCYALAEVTSKPKVKKTSPDSHLWKEIDKSELKANIKITHNLVFKPILKEDVLKIDELSELKVGNQGTNFKATKEEFEMFLSIIENNSYKNLIMKNIQSKQSPLNQILYGAPGTGKTYTTKKLAIEIIDNKEYDENDRKTILDRYDELIKSNQIQFTTFHQSMSYEDFIEGIKPETIDNRVTYEVKDGIFKRLAQIASKEVSKTINKKEFEEKILLFDDAWNSLIEETQKALDNGSSYIINTITNKDLEIKAISNQGNLIIQPKVDNALEYTVSYNRTKRLFETFTDLNEIKNIDKDFRTVIGGSNSTAYWSVLNFIHIFLDENSSQKEPLTIEPPKRYVIIIDEINRGNVSAIFGELITLIEDDKRKPILNKKEEFIEVELPYSQEKFSVPDNLYIIGTMNTADRSVEALDTALRRRFSFVEMPSKPKKLADIILEDAEEINLTQLLNTINQRIELLIDKDHQIGHSFFINLKNIDELKTTFKNKIIPLLEEYFFGDFGKIGLVLGENFISVKNENNNSGILAKFSAYEDVDFITEKKIYQIKNCEELETEDFISIYE